MAPTYSNDQIARQLTHGFWGGTSRKLEVSEYGSILVNLDGLSYHNNAYTFALKALELWSAASGLTFTHTSGAAQIYFGELDYNDAYCYSDVDGSTINFSYVNVGQGWTNFYGDEYYSYTFQTFVHEIGHALGLGHAGNYNGTATYGEDNHYANDSWQSSVMSYFSQDENTSVAASHAYALTPQVADIIAIRNLYGITGTTNTGDTYYGDYASGDMLQWLSASYGWPSFTILDDGGTDTLNFSETSADQTIDLRQEAVSSVGGKTGNMMIARGTVIEYAYSGSGNDILIGNSSLNRLKGGSGNDKLYGNGGNDLLLGERGDDRLEGGTGNDYLDAGRGSGGWQYLFGNSGNDRYYVSADNGMVLLHDTSGYDKIFLRDITYSDLDISSRSYSGSSGWGTTLDLVWTDSGGGRLRITNDARHINYFEFEDGLVLSSLKRLSDGFVQLVGTSGANILTGTGAREKIYGRGGDDVLNAGTSTGSWQYLFGETGDDIYAVARDGGQVLIEDSSGNDLLVLQDLFIHDLEISSTTYSSGDWGTTLNLAWNKAGASGEVRIADKGRAIEMFEFYEGRKLSSIDLLNSGTLQLTGTSRGDIISGTGLRDKIYGGDGNDVLSAGDGDGGWQYLIGEAGDDIYRYASGDGTVFIDDTVGSSRIRFSDLDFSDFTFSSTDYGNHRWGETLNMISTEGELRISDNARNVNSFEFADGLVLKSIGFLSGDLLEVVAKSGDDVITGTDLRDKIFGGSGDDTLDAGGTTGGWQYLFGDSGDDVLRYSTTNGTVFIDDTQGSNTVRFLDLDFNDLTFSFTHYGGSWGTTLNMHWDTGPASGQLRIAHDASHIDSFEFADGMVLKTLGFLSDDQMLIVAKSGDDTITGGDLRDKIFGGSGDDTLDAGGTTGGWQYLYGDSGNDTFLYSQSNGKVFVDDSSGANDILRFTDLDRGDVTVSTTDYGSHPWGETLNLSWDTGGDSGQVRITNLGSEIEQFIFSDGSIFDADDFFI